jgi:hypothetical protein
VNWIFINDFHAEMDIDEKEGKPEEEDKAETSIPHCYQLK